MSSKISEIAEPLSTEEEIDNLVRSKKKIRKTDGDARPEEISTRNHERLDFDSPQKLDLKRKKTYHESVTGIEDVKDDEMEGVDEEQEVNEDDEDQGEDGYHRRRKFEEPDAGKGISVEQIDAIPHFTLTEKEWERVRKLFKKSLIIKLFGMKIGFNFLLKKVNQLWAQAGEIQLVDLGNEYYLAMFDSNNDFTRALVGGPWVVLDHYLTIQTWSRMFDPKIEKISKIAAWIGKLVKIDHNTELQARGKYARICVEIDLGKPLLSQYAVHGSLRNIEYEGIHYVCFECGTYGHDIENCPIRKARDEPKDKQQEREEAEKEMEREGKDPRCREGGNNYGTWIYAQKPKRNRRSRPKAGMNTNEGVAPGIVVYGDEEELSQWLEADINKVTRPEGEPPDPNRKDAVGAARPLDRCTSPKEPHDKSDFMEQGEVRKLDESNDTMKLQAKNKDGAAIPWN
ncbi:hypothetical protein G2W53_017222 [Senna tora]|uniref:CCHC-type domain-containing protein n=1 Tax=Senna tora TaxID=362788 RepID=A0A834TPJ0_9FABA|nr:hypothetical protein G2W53_017222 [Senna tora]